MASSGPHPPASPAELRDRVAALSAQVRALADGAAAPRVAEESFSVRSTRLLASVIAMAELAAAEIRADAQREAEEIRLHADAAIAEAQGALARYRDALGALAAETGQIEHAVAELRARARALEAESSALERALGAARRERG